MKDSSTSQNLFELVKKYLNEIGGMDDLTISKNLECVGVDGDAVIQGHKISVCKNLETNYVQYILVIYYMDHRMKLAFRIVSKYPTVSKVENLVYKLYIHFCWCPKNFMEF
jgi:hypothetical protein